MIPFLIKRFIGLLFVIFGVTFITFIMGYFAPGDPIRNLLGQHFDPGLYAQLKHSYGLDLPWYQQYYNFLTHLLRLDFGPSFKYVGQDVWNILKSGVPVSIELGFWALMIQILLGVPLGIFSALKANTWIDTVNMSVILILFAVPVFVLSLLFQIGVVWLDQQMGSSWPVSGWGNPWQYTWSDLQFKLGPIFIYSFTGMAYIARLARTSMLEVLRQDYIRTARAKGLQERLILYRHALRNALIPLITVLGISLGLLVTGSFFIEQVFNIPGIAQITVASINGRDYPVIQAATVLLAITVVLGNLLSDILYTIIDPRIKVS